MASRPDSRKADAAHSWACLHAGPAADARVEESILREGPGRPDDFAEVRSARGVQLNAGISATDAAVPARRLLREIAGFSGAAVMIDASGGGVFGCVNPMGGTNRNEMASFRRIRDIRSTGRIHHAVSRGHGRELRPCGSRARIEGS